MTIYIDLIILENICMNYIILFGTAYIMKIKIKYFKILISSIIGAIYSVLLYMQIIPIYSNVIMKFFLSIVMTYIAYNPKNIKLALKELILFYLISFVFGGCAFALLYFVKPENIFMRNGVYIGTYPLKIAFLGGIVGFIITYIAFRMIKNRTSKNNIIYKLKIINNGKSIEINALLDTGNMLKDPITKTPVIVVEKEQLKELLPEIVLNNIEKILGGDLTKENDNINSYLSKFRVIPYNSIGKQNGILLAFKADKISIYINGEEKELKDVIIGIYNESFKNSRYNALVGLEILEKAEALEVL